MPAQLPFRGDSLIAQRQPKTDRLILERLLKDAANDKRLDDNELRTAHRVLLKWADLESSGRLDELNETQMQGDFLAEVFGQALRYAGPLDGKDVWHREQHHQIAGETPDAILGFFREGEERKPFAVIELEGPTTNLDRDRSNGRTGVGQCWDYLVNTPPECRWGIVSIRLVNPNTRTCPIFRSWRDAEVTKAVYRRIPILIDRNREGPTANPWGIRFQRMFDQTNDAELFKEPPELSDSGYKLKGNTWSKGKHSFLPLYEAKMCRPYDHRHGSIYLKAGNWYMQGKTTLATLVDHQNPEHVAIPRYWADKDEIESRLDDWGWPFLFAFRDVVRPTDERTLIAHFVPRVGAINTMPLLMVSADPKLQCCLMANFNAFALDFVSRQKVSQAHMNFFVVEQLPVLPPDTYSKRCPWDRQTTLQAWISERVLKLTCTAEDMLPLAEACNFTTGSFQKEYGGRLNKWDADERMQLMAELDGLFAHLYGLSEEEFLYILTTFTGVPDPIRIACGNAFRDVAHGFVR